MPKLRRFGKCLSFPASPKLHRCPLNDQTRNHSRPLHARSFLRCGKNQPSHWSTPTSRNTVLQKISLVLIASPIAPHLFHSPFVSFFISPMKSPLNYGKANDPNTVRVKEYFQKGAKCWIPAHGTPFRPNDNHFRIEVQMTEKEKTIYYIHRNTQFAEWPFDVHFNSVSL